MKRLLTLATLLFALTANAQFNYPNAGPMWFYLARIAAPSFDTITYSAASFPGILQYRQQPNDSGYYFSNGRKYVKVGTGAPVTASNGLTQAGQDIRIGGSLTGTTTVNGQGNTLNFVNTDGGNNLYRITIGSALTVFSQVGGTGRYAEGGWTGAGAVYLRSNNNGQTGQDARLTVDGTGVSTIGSFSLATDDASTGVYKLLTRNNSTGRVETVAPAALPTPDLQAVLTQGNVANTGMTLTSSGGIGAISFVPLDFNNSLSVGAASSANALPSSITVRGSSGSVGLFKTDETNYNSSFAIESTSTGLRLNKEAKAGKTPYIQFGAGNLEFRAGSVGVETVVAKLFSDGRLSGSPAQNANDFVTLSQLKYQSIRSVTASTAVTGTDRTIINKATADNPTIALPTGAAEIGREITIIEGAADPTSNGCNWSPAVRVDGSTTATSFATLGSVKRVTVQYDGSEWWVKGF